MKELTKKEIEVLQSFKGRTLHDIENDIFKLLGEDFGDSVAVRVTHKKNGVIYQEDCSSVVCDDMINLYNTKELRIANVSIDDDYYNDIEEENPIIKQCIDFEVSTDLIKIDGIDDLQYLKVWRDGVVLMTLNNKKVFVLINNEEVIKDTLHILNDDYTFNEKTCKKYLIKSYKISDDILNVELVNVSE